MVFNIFDVYIISAKSHSRCAQTSERFVNCLYVFVFVITRRGARSRALSFECKIEQADFTDWKSFLTCNFTDEISPNSDTLSANT